MPYEWEPAYRHERNTLIDGEQDSSKSYDKYLLMLGGGALALSVTFIHDIIGDGPVRFPWFIFSAWISFALSVSATLISIHQSAPLYRNFRDILDQKAEHAGGKFLWTEVRTEQANCRRLPWIDRLNYGGLALFLLGVMLLLLFTGFNLTGVPPMTDKAQEQSKVINEGMKPPLAPADGNPTTVSPAGDTRAGIPPLAPVDVAPPQPAPVDVAPPQPAPSEPGPSQPPGGQD